MLAIILPTTLWGQITLTTDTNGNGTIEDNEKNLYLIQTNQCESFYMIPKDNNVSTANIPNADMLWYFLDAGEVSGTQYYYIINNSTGKCIYNHNGNSRGIILTLLNDLSADEKEKCKFKLVENNTNGTVGFYNIDVKATQTYYGLNKQGGSVNISNPVRLTNNQYINEYNSKWKFIPYNGTFTWPDPPFTPSTNSQNYYYKIHNITNESYYVSSDADSPKNATIASTASDNMIWYFKEADSSDPWIKYYYIVNLAAREYMYYKGTAINGSNQDNAIVLKDKTLENEDRFQFIIVRTARIVKINNNDEPVEAYTIIPKLLKDKYWASSCISPTSITDGNKLGIRNGRGSDTNNSHWLFDDIYIVDPPTITNNFDGTISLSTTTLGATIYYTTNGSTPNNTSTVYSSAFSLGDAEVIKAIAYVDLDFSIVSTYNVPQYDTPPTISFNNATSKVTITSEGTVYYNTGNGSQDDPTPSTGTPYSEPFDVNSVTTVKAIAISPGYLASTVAELAITKVATPTIQNNGSNAISITSATDGATIYYTTDGTTPTTSSTEYTAPLTEGVSGVTIKAIAVKENMLNSAVGSGSVTLQCATPVIVRNCDGFSISCAFPATGVTIYYTIDESTPTLSSEHIPSGGSVINSSTVIVKAMAVAADYNNSEVAEKYIMGNTYPENYLTFSVLTDGTISWKAFGDESTKTIEYSINGGGWTSLTSTTDGVTFNVNEGDLVRFRGNNETYATSNANYSGFEGGTATFDIEGNIHSLLYGDGFVGNNSLTDEEYQFCSIFKKSLVISAENLILPATTLTNDCYRAMFSLCTTLEKAPALPATTLATECYRYMFECCAITTAPDLEATNLVTSCYAHMFVGCTNLKYIKCLATSGINNTNLEHWVGKKDAESTLGVAETGFFVKDTDVTWSTTGTNGIPLGWTIYNDFFLNSPEITCDGDYNITITCATPGASIYYKLNQAGDFLPYSTPLSISETTIVEAYSTKDPNTSPTVTVTFDIYDNPFDESTRSLDTWNYGITQVTLPFSVNRTDGHSTAYSKGTYTFETTIPLYKLQPTYLWFQHADQSADIYVDDVFVTTHWGGYNAFFVDISDYVHVGTNRIKVVLNNTIRNTLAPADGDFNFNATLGKVKLLTSPIMPSMDYGYDGMHITSSVTNASATINIKTSIPEGANVTCIIDAEDGSYHFTDTKASTGSEMTFTTTISDPHLWNGLEDPFLYNVTLEIRDNVYDELYHRYQRTYGFRYYSYDYSTGFFLNGEPYKLRGVCMHHDLEEKANALDDDDIANDFAIIQDLGCNFIRLAHYPHPKEVYDWCDRLGIVVQTEVPCVNKFRSPEAAQNPCPQEYYDHLEIQYEDMVRQHYNHPSILFWGLFNEAGTDNSSWAKTKLEYYRTLIKNIDAERWVGYVVASGTTNPSSSFGNPDMDWFGCNIYVGWYSDTGTNDPTTQLSTRKTNIITNKHKPLAFSEYGAGGTQHCHSDDPQSTTNKGSNGARHDIEYQMWIHEGHIAAIKEFPELLFTSQWQLFDIAVSKRKEGYTICLDGENTSTDDDLKYLNNKGLVERDHRTKKDTYYLYKAWWNQTDKFVHICGKDYEKLTDRVIKCYTNDGNSLSLYVNNSFVETVTVTDNIATFTARDFDSNDVIRVEGATTHDAFSLNNEFITDGEWNVNAHWKCNSVPVSGSDVVIKAECTIPNGVSIRANSITICENGSLTIEDGGQLIVNNAGVEATVKKSVLTWNPGTKAVSGWQIISAPTHDAEHNYVSFSNVDNLVYLVSSNPKYDVYMFDEPTTYWWANLGEHPFSELTNGRGYLYRTGGSEDLAYKGELNYDNVEYGLSYACENDNYKGFNLIGNPYSHTIYKGTTDGIAIPNGDLLAANYYVLTSDGIWTLTSDGTAIPLGAAILVQAQKAGTLTMANSTLGASAKSRNENIWLTVKNSEYSDVACIEFNDKHGLNKMSHHNEAAPMLYINYKGENFASANVSNSTKVIDLCFKAKTLSKYTLSLNADGNFSYLHLIDKMNGDDVDMLIDSEYSFISAPNDNEHRFILKIAYASDGDDTNDIFAYQYGGDIVVYGSGELQVFDITGRSVMTTTINGIETIKVPITGVYIFRLIGNEVKTQKIVVK